MNIDPLPNKWEVKRLGELSSAIQYGYTAKATTEQLGPKLLRITDIQNDAVDWDAVPFCEISAKETEKYRLGKNDLLFARTGATVGKSYLIPGSMPESVFASYLIRVRLLETVCPKYVAYFFRSGDYWRQITENQAGIGQPNVNGTKLAQIKIPVAPLNQQGLIVAEIDKQFSRLDEAVANLKRVKANLKRYKAAVLKAAVEGNLTEDWRKQHPNVEPASILLERILTERRAKWNGRGKYKGPDTLETTGLSLLPNNWKWASLDQLLLNITDGDHQPPPQTDSGVPFLVIGNVRSGKLEFEGTRFVSRQHADAVDVFRKPTRGDILYTLVGSFGIALRVDTNREFCIQRHIGILRPHKISPTSYLVHALNSLFIFSQATNAATGTAQKTVPLAGLRRFAIPLPPLAEQQEIVAEVERRLSVIGELEVAVEANLTRADRLRQSVLQRAFSGRLKVTEGAATLDLSTPGGIAQPNAPYISTEEILMSKRPTTSPRHMRALLDALEEVNSPVSPEELFSLCGFDSAAIEQVERFYAELNELINSNKVEELRPAQDQVTLRVIQ